MSDPRPAQIDAAFRQIVDRLTHPGTVISVRRVPVQRDWADEFALTFYKLLGLVPVAFLASLALDRLAAAEVRVPALGWTDCLIVLTAAWSVLGVLRRARWF